MAFLEFPKMLYRGEESCVVATPDAEAAKVAAGWGYTPGADAAPVDAPEAADVAPVRKKPGPKPKE